jgi:type IV secretion system protein VirD4
MQLESEPPKARQDDWSAVPPVALEARPAISRSADDDPDNAGIRREPELPEHEAIAPETPPSPDPFAILVDEADDESQQANMLRQRMRVVARQAALDPNDGIEL